MAITPNGKTVLIAEDDAIAREGMAIILHREGYGVATAANGQEALEYLRTQPAPSLILLDMLMPVLDGWLFMAQLRKVPGCESVPVVVVTGMPIASKEWTKALGAVDLIKKPISLESLWEVVRQHC